MYDWESICDYFLDTLLGNNCLYVLETERSWIRCITCCSRSYVKILQEYYTILENRRKKGEGKTENKKW